MNYCRSCKHDFGSVGAFDAHRTGKHQYTYSQGIHMEPMREDGRRCLGTDELLSAGWREDGNGRWRSPGGWDFA